jgi:hypothetical protein
MKEKVVVLYEQTKGNKEMKISVSLNDANRMEIVFSASEKFGGEVVLNFGKHLSNINAEAVRVALNVDNYDQMMERIKELYLGMGTPFAYELFVEFLRSRQIIPTEAI